MLTRDILDQARSIEPEIVALRRAIHADPELGLHTPKTCDKVRAALAGLPLEWRQGPSTTGMVATLKGEAGAGRRVLLRGDMDALPMPEETGLDFASKVEGAMHACGHDAHTAMLVGAARLLCERRSAFAGEVQFMFQPGEEGWHGARFMLDDGLIDPLPHAAFALHIMPNAPHGVIAGRTGPLLAAADQLEIFVEGAGGHASMPHQTRDPIPVAAEIVMALQAMVTRQFNVHDPVVITVASVSAGSAHNVIPDRAVLKGTMRSLSHASRARLRDAVELLAVGIAGAHGLSAKVTILEGFPVTICDAAAVDFGEKVSRDMLGQDSFQRLADPIMGAEDFAYVLEKVPGAMFFLGVAPQGDNWASCCGIHSTRMMIDEGAMPIGSALLAALGERFLADGFAA
ncbi:M20 family metallopeptidase [Novosphingobium aquae]|uniref:M20 family metallopeptidase n=1 Tax=Novosphingobium aquae TaxID=3133435 RepID=A0ABU8S8H8_9SPHN